MLIFVNIVTFNFKSNLTIFQSTCIRLVMILLMVRNLHVWSAAENSINSTYPLIFESSFRNNILMIEQETRQRRPSLIFMILVAVRKYRQNEYIMQDSFLL